MSPTSGGAVSLASESRGDGDEALIAYVADAEERAIHRVDVGRKRWLGVTELDGTPGQVLALADGRVAVTLTDRHRVVIYEPMADRELRPLCEAPAPREPLALAVAGDGEGLMVASAYAATVTAYDLATLSPRWSLSVPAEPRSLLAEGEALWVSHAVGGRLSRIAWGAAEPKVVPIDLRLARAGARGDDSPWRPTNQSYALASVALPGGGRRLVAPSVSVDPGVVREPISSGYGASDGPPTMHPYVAMIDPSAPEQRFTRLADAETRRGRCMLPRGVAAEGHRLWVTCMGQDALLELDGRAVDPMTALRRRIPMPAGPTALATHRGHGVVLAALDHAVALVDLDRATTAALPLPRRAGRPTSDARLERGRRLFHTTDDTRISRDGRACASCHPDGRSDGLTWSTPDGPRQSIMLAGRLSERGRFGWSGRHRNMGEHLQQTMSRLRGRGLSAEDREALVHYLQHMPAPAPAPPVASDRLAIGEALFHSEELGCGTCHPGGGSDDARYDVGSGDPVEASLKFDTPSLRFVAITAPYFHDGRYATLSELLRGDDRMGHEKDLSGDEVAALEAYVRSL